MLAILWEMVKILCCIAIIILLFSMIYSFVCDMYDEQKAKQQVKNFVDMLLAEEKEEQQQYLEYLQKVDEKVEKITKKIDEHKEKDKEL